MDLLREDNEGFEISSYDEPVVNPENIYDFEVESVKKLLIRDSIGSSLNSDVIAKKEEEDWCEKPTQIERIPIFQTRKLKKEVVEEDCKTFCKKKFEGKKEISQCKKECKKVGGSEILKKVKKRKEQIEEDKKVAKIDKFIDKIERSIKSYVTIYKSEDRSKEHRIVVLSNFILESFEDGHFKKIDGVLSSNSINGDGNNEEYKTPPFNKLKDPKLISSIEELLIKGYPIEVIASVQYKVDARAVKISEIQNEFIEHSKEEVVHAGYIKELLEKNKVEVKEPLGVRSIKPSGLSDLDMIIYQLKLEKEAVNFYRNILKKLPTDRTTRTTRTFVYLERILFSEIKHVRDLENLIQKHFQDVKLEELLETGSISSNNQDEGEKGRRTLDIAKKELDFKQKELVELLSEWIQEIGPYSEINEDFESWYSSEYWESLLGIFSDQEYKSKHHKEFPNSNKSLFNEISLVKTILSENPKVKDLIHTFSKGSLFVEEKLTENFTSNLKKLQERYERVQKQFKGLEFGIQEPGHLYALDRKNRFPDKEIKTIRTPRNMNEKLLKLMNEYDTILIDFNNFADGFHDWLFKRYVIPSGAGILTTRCFGCPPSSRIVKE